MRRSRSAPRRPRSGNAALAAGALVEAALGAVFVLAGLCKVVVSDDAEALRRFVRGSAVASDGPVSFLVP